MHLRQPAMASASYGAGPHARVMNQLQAVALNEGLRCKKRLWRTERQQLESSQSGAVGQPATARPAGVAGSIKSNHRGKLESQAVEQEVEKCLEAQRLATHPGVGPLTAMAFALIIGEAVNAFSVGKQVASYSHVLVPLEDSSGNRRRLGTHHRISKEVRSSCASYWWRKRRRSQYAVFSGLAQPILSPDDA